MASYYYLQTARLLLQAVDQGAVQVLFTKYWTIFHSKRLIQRVGTGTGHLVSKFPTRSYTASRTEGAGLTTPA